jgi:FlaA1/EpsC-like NDP-sugar epimerase
MKSAPDAKSRELFHGKRILIVGGTGSLGQVLLHRLLGATNGKPDKVIVFSRDEAKQHAIRVKYQHRRSSTDDIAYRNFESILKFRIGDVRDPAAIGSALRDADIVFNAAALKQVPTCEYNPFEAVMTNIGGAQNIVHAIQSMGLKVETVIGVSTDKAVKPVNVMGMTKALHERVLVCGNLHLPHTRFVIVRYGNVLISRGSVIPFFHEQIRNGGPVSITDPAMTRFLLSLEEAVDVILDAVADARRGETYVPRVPSALITDVAKALIADRPIKTIVTGVRPGEKIHEILVSEEEMHRAFERGHHYVIAPILPELRDPKAESTHLTQEYSSERELLSFEAVRELLERRKLMVGQMGVGVEDEVLQ